jgi:glycerate 2-kinase
MTERELLRAMFDAAVAAAQPEICVKRFLPKPPKGRTVVIGAGKASASMARAFEDAWKHPLEGLVVTRYGYGVECKRIKIVEAAHPVPDAAGLQAAHDILNMVQGLAADDLVVALISGGGSSLLSLPAPGLTAEDKRVVNKALLASGAPIQEMNTVRKHLSAIKGGRLAAAAFPARVETLVISDVPGDDLSDVASGPTVPDATTFADALAIIAKYNMKLSAPVMEHLHKAANETPKPEDPRLARAVAHLIASPQASLEAAAKVARSNGYTPLILGDSLEGEARELGIVMAGMALQAKRFAQPAKPPCVLISGGEGTVTIRGNGVGGRNVEFLLSLALKLHGADGISAIACDTDGVDGGAEVAGAIITPDTLQRARNVKLDSAAMLANNDAHNFFAKLGDQVITGPTLTNVNDFRAILIT